MWRRLFNASLVFAVSCQSVVLAAAAKSDLSATTASEIRSAATASNSGPAGHPLPLSSHWNTGATPPGDTFDPEYQLSLISKGHHVMPFFTMPGPDSKPSTKMDYWEKPIKRCAELHLPISLLASQWEAGLTFDKEWFDLPADKNPNVVTIDGKIRKEVDPFGPVEPWREMGRRWGGNVGLEQLEKWYPDPPKVMLISNNEHSKLQWTDAEQSKRYMDRFGPGRDDNSKRKVLADGWVEHYRALIGGFRDGISNADWKKNSIFVGYDAFGPPHFARWPQWKEYSLYSPNEVDFSAKIWDGGSPSFYTHNWNSSTDYTVQSPQIESMNWVFMLDDAQAINPEFWFELGTWDGSVDQKNDKRRFYARKKQNYDADRYGGMVQFGMWLMRPRTVREFRGWTERRSLQGQYFLAVVEGVDRVWSNATLADFWRHGRLVANVAHEHPYQAQLPPEYKSRQRWFLLDSDQDPPRPWGAGTELSVLSLALVKGDSGDRQWLIYAHSPLADRKDVKVTLPGYGEVSINPPPRGVFYHVLEKTKNVVEIPVPLLPKPIPPAPKSELDP